MQAHEECVHDFRVRAPVWRRNGDSREYRPAEGVENVKQWGGNTRIVYLKIPLRYQQQVRDVHEGRGWLPLSVRLVLTFPSPTKSPSTGAG